MTDAAWEECRKEYRRTLAAMQALGQVRDFGQNVCEEVPATRCGGGFKCLTPKGKPMKKMSMKHMKGGIHKPSRPKKVGKSVRVPVR